MFCLKTRSYSNLSTHEYYITLGCYSGLFVWRTDDPQRCMCNSYISASVHTQGAYKYSTLSQVSQLMEPNGISVGCTARKQPDEGSL